MPDPTKMRKKIVMKTKYLETQNFSWVQKKIIINQ